MSATRWDGAKVPTASDPILSAWGDYADSVGTFIRCASQAEAQARLAQAPAGVVTAAHPAHQRPHDAQVGGDQLQSADPLAAGVQS